jgi:protein-disulfide isomerase
MAPILFLTALLLLPLGSTATAAVSHTKIIEHIRKQFSTPKTLKMKIDGLKPSPLKGYLKGKIHFDGAGQKSARDIHISNDGKYYFLAPVFSFKKSKIPGLLQAAEEAHHTEHAGHSHNATPPVYMSADGKHFFIGSGIGAPQNASVDPDEENRKKISLKNVFGRGPVGAPVTLVEYSDMQCPYCKMAHEMLADKLSKTYGKKVRWVSKQYPLRNNHPWAYDAAIASLCAGKQSKKAYNKMADAIFHDQKAITPKNLREKTLGYAKAAGLKMTSFTRCFDKKETAKLVDADIKEANALGVVSTPTVFINGRKVGRIDFPTISGIIDEKLAEKK